VSKVTFAEEQDMIANAKRLCCRLAVGLGLALLGLGVAGGIAAASPAQPAPTDDPFVPTLPDPGIVNPTPTNSLGVLSNAAQVMPVLTDAGSFLSAGQDPAAYVGDLQNLLNDGGNLLALPAAGSYIPQMPLNASNPTAAPPDSGQ
jgi:hypothetical protein